MLGPGVVLSTEPLKQVTIRRDRNLIFLTKTTKVLPDGKRLVPQRSFREEGLHDLAQDPPPPSPAYRQVSKRESGRNLDSILGGGRQGAALHRHEIVFRTLEAVGAEHDLLRRQELDHPNRW